MWYTVVGGRFSSLLLHQWCSPHGLCLVMHTLWEELHAATCCGKWHLDQEFLKSKENVDLSRCWYPRACHQPGQQPGFLTGPELVKDARESSCLVRGGCGVRRAGTLSETFMAFLDRGESKESLTACKLPSTDVFAFSFCFFFACCFVSSCACLSLRSQFSPGFCGSHTMFYLYSTLPTAMLHTSLSFALLCSHYSASPTFPLLLSLHAFFLVSLPTCTSPVSTCCS